MLNVLKKLAKKLLGRTSGEGPVQALIKKGVIKVGSGCEISGLQALVFHTEQGVTNIEIGNNSCVRGTLVIYRPESKIIIGNNVYIGHLTTLECAEEIRIGNDVLISMQCNLIDTNSHSLHSYERVRDTIDWQKGLEYKDWSVVHSKKISIGDNCWLGLRSIVTKGVVLGEGTIVGAGSVVTKGTEPFSVVAGNPAVFIKHVD
jgi:acetyltransferase-like isoleucine patch superfamily enzyme